MQRKIISIEMQNFSDIPPIIQSSGLHIKNLPTDILMQIAVKLDPISLYYLSLSNKFFNTLLISEQKTDVLWDLHLSKHFLLDPTPPLLSSCFFKETSNKYYSGFNKNEKECFIMVRANDLSLMTAKKINFTIKILNKSDSQGHVLLSLVRKQNNPGLNAYIFKQIFENKNNYKYEDVIVCAIQLDQADENVINLLAQDGVDQILNNKRCLDRAIQYNSIHFLELFLKKRPDLEEDRGVHPRPLYYAAQEGRVEIVRLLLKHQASVNALHNDYTPLYIAAQKGHLEVVKILIEGGANINLQTGNQSFPLYVAMQEKHTAIVKLLLEQGADVGLTYFGFSSLYQGVRQNHVEGVKILLTHFKEKRIHAGINHVGGNGSTPLYAAAQNGHDAMVELLLQSGAEVDCEFAGVTPLYTAAQNGHHLIVKMLCNHKANYRRIFPDYNGSTALYVAAQNGHVEIVEFLCQLPNCDFDAAIHGNYTPLYVACQKGHYAIAAILLMSGAKVDYPTQRKATALYVAAQNGHAAIVQLLLRYKANPHVRFEMAIHLYMFFVGIIIIMIRSFLYLLFWFALAQILYI